MVRKIWVALLAVGWRNQERAVAGQQPAQFRHALLRTIAVQEPGGVQASTPLAAGAGNFENSSARCNRAKLNAAPAYSIVVGHSSASASLAVHCPARRHPAWRASCSEQNHRSPLASSILVRW